jgi:hypothetical protein
MQPRAPYAEYMQGALDSSETVKAYANRMQSNWREAGWKAGPEEPKAQQMLYDLVWSGLRPGIKARIRPFAGEEGTIRHRGRVVRKSA